MARDRPRRTLGRVDSEVAIALALCFAMTNGLHDASNAIAALVATRAATPAQAIALAAVGNMIGPLLLGAAVADTIGGIVELPAADAIHAIGAGLAAAVAWNVATWRLGLPSSSGHALVGGLGGAALAAGGAGAVRWGGFDGLHPVGVAGALVALAVSPLLGAAVAFAAISGLRRSTRRATSAWAAPVRAGQWILSGTLALSHGTNDVQKSIGVVTAVLVADRSIGGSGPPLWVQLACAAALTLGTTLGGWSIVATIGRRIYRLHAIDGLAVEGASSAVILGASALGAPVSTTQVVASAVVGAGGGRSRSGHIRWATVRAMSLAWLVTLPGTAALAAVAFLGWDAA
jgi:PiT family inorganic phosphate transporter